MPTSKVWAWSLTFALSLLAAPSASADPPPTLGPVISNPPSRVFAGNMTPRERVWTWDMNIDGAYGRVFPDGQDSRGTAFGRVRVGVLHIHDSLYFSAGPTYEISRLAHATFGLQGEVMHIETGLWFQVGCLLDTQPHPGAMVAVGWSLFGLEFQYREYDRYNLGETPAVYAKIRIPIGIIARAFK